MKKYIEYYYNLDVCDLKYDGKKYTFNSKNEAYILKILSPFQVTFDYQLLENRIERFNSFFSIVLNRNNELITPIENKSYILLKNNNDLHNVKINIFDIETKMIVETNGLNKILRFPWINFWKSKIDYLEKWIDEKKTKYKKIFPVFNYFLGISENALLYLENALSYNNSCEVYKFCIQHDRVDVNTDLYSYYDPTNIIIDHKSRDIGEYIKSLWFNGIFELNEFENFLNNNSFSKFDAMVLYSRILFPSFFFDIVEDKINNNDIECLSLLEKKTEDFLIFLERVQNLLFDKYGIEKIKWIS